MFRLFFPVFFISLIFSPVVKIYEFCKMSKDNVCKCNGEKSKHSCCRIIKVYKDLNSYSKNNDLNITQVLDKILISFENFKEYFNIEKNIKLNIHAPPLYLFNAQLLI